MFAPYTTNSLRSTRSDARSAGDGAFGSHATAARGAFQNFKTLVESLLQRTRGRSTEATETGRAV